MAGICSAHQNPVIGCKKCEATARTNILSEIHNELVRAYAKHGSEQWGRHEFYAIMKEEVDEAWDAIKQNLPMAVLKKEIIQIAAMCIRYLETGDRYRHK